MRRFKTTWSVVLVAIVLFAGAVASAQRHPNALPRTPRNPELLVQQVGDSARVIVDWQSSPPASFTLDFYTSVLRTADSVLSVQTVPATTTLDTHTVGLPLPGDTLVFRAAVLVTDVSGLESDSAFSNTASLIGPIVPPSAPSGVTVTIDTLASSVIGFRGMWVTDGIGFDSIADDIPANVRLGGSVQLSVAFERSDGVIDCYGDPIFCASRGWVYLGLLPYESVPRWLGLAGG